MFIGEEANGGTLGAGTTCTSTDQYKDMKKKKRKKNKKRDKQINDNMHIYWRAS